MAFSPGRKPNLTASQSGQASVIITGALMAIAVAAIFLSQWNKITNYQLQQTVAKMEIDTILTQVQSGIRQALLSRSDLPGCPGQLSSANLAGFRNFDSDPNPVEFTLTNPQAKQYSCIIPDEFANRIANLQVSIVGLATTSAALSRQVEVTVTINTKGLTNSARPNGQIARVTKMVRRYLLSPMTLSRFGLVFHSPVGGGESFIEALGGARVRVQADTLFASTETPLWQNLVPGTAPQVVLTRENFARFKSVTSDSDFDSQNFRYSYPNGIETGVLQEGFVPTFLPSGGAQWNIPTDYFPQYQDHAYPVPQASFPTVSYCGSSQDEFNQSRLLSALPDPNNGPVNVSDTCSNGANSVFVFVNAGANLAVHLKTGDSNFCGMVVANTLTVFVDSADTTPFGLIGHFVVRKLSVQATAGGTPEVRLFNPIDGTAPEGIAPLPGGQTIYGISDKFRSLGSSTGKNFYVPFNSAMLDGFHPVSADDYMTNVCSDSETSGFHTYQAMYQSPDALPGFPTYSRDQAGTIYALEIM